MVKCDEAMRAVSLTQSVPGGGKQSMTRTYHFDKARCRGRGLSRGCRVSSVARQGMAVRPPWEVAELQCGGHRSRVHVVGMRNGP